MVHHINRLKDHHNKFRKSLWASPTSLHKISPKEIEIEGTFLNIVKTAYDQHVLKDYIWSLYLIKASMHLMKICKTGTTWKHFFNNEARVLTPCGCSIRFGILATATEERTKTDTGGGRSKISLAEENMTLYLKDSTIKTLRTDDQFCQIIKMYNWERHQKTITFTIP